MMDPEDLQSDLLALRRLYGLLVKDEHYVEDTGSENLDKNTRRLLISLLDSAANKAFDAHTKILDTQFGATYSSWSTLQGQSRDVLRLKSFSLRNAPTDGGYQSLQNVDLLTGQGIFSEPTNQVDLAGEPGSRMKRCRVCQKPKVKQLTKEISFRDSKAFAPVNILQNQNHKRRWEVENDPSTVGGSAGTSNGQFFTNLTDQEDNISRKASTKILQLESCISSLQVAVKHANFLKNESLNEPKKTGQFSVITSDPNSSTSRRIWKRRDMGHQWHDQTTRLINELALQGPLVNTMLPSSQIVSQQVEKPVVDKVEMFNPRQNQYDHIPDEAYYLFQSSGSSSNMKKPADKNRFLHRNMSSQINRQQLDQLQMAKTEAVVNTMLPSSRITSQVEEPVVDKSEMFNPIQSQYDHTPDDAYYPFHSGGNSSKMKKPADKNRFLHRNMSSQINRQPLDQLQMAKTEAVRTSEITEWQEPPVGYVRPFNEQQKAKLIGRNKLVNTYTDQMDHYRGKHEVVDPTRLVSVATQRRSKSPVSSSNYSTQIQSRSESQSPSPSPSPTQSQIYHSFSDEGSSLPHREVYSGSSGSEAHEKSESELNSVSSQYQNPYKGSSHESSGSMSRRTVPKRGHKKGDPKPIEPNRKSESKMKTVLNPDQSLSMSSSSNESSRSRMTVFKRGHKKGNQKEPKRKSEIKMNTVSNLDQSSSSNEFSGSNSTETIPKRGLKKGNPKEPKRKSESKNSTVSSQDQSHIGSRSSESSGSGSGRMVPKKGHQKGNKEEPKRRSETSRSNEFSGSGSGSGSASGSWSGSGSGSRSGSGSGSGSRSGSGSASWSGSGSGSYSGSRSGSGSESRRTVPKQGHRKGKEKESKRKSESTVSSEDQSSYTGSSSNESSGSDSRQTTPKKGNQKEPEKSQGWRLGKLKDKLAIIFHQHHHHHHHHNDDDGSGSGGGKDNYKKAWKQTKKVISHGRKHGGHAVKKIGSKALVLKKYEAHAEHAVKKIASNAVKKIESKAKHKAHHEHTVKKNESKALVIQKDEAHGEHGVKKSDSKALVLINDGAHGEHLVKKSDSKALVVINDGAHDEHAVKKNESKALVLIKDETHGEHAVKKNENKALVVIKDKAHGSHAVKKVESKALVVHKAADKKESKALVLHKSGGKKQKGQLQALVSGLLKQSHQSIKSSKSKTATPSHLSEQKHCGGSGSTSGGGGKKRSGGGKLGKKMTWLQMLRQQRRLERIEKLRCKIDTGKRR